MATLRQYYETDFSNALRVNIKMGPEHPQTEGAILYNFIEVNSFLAFYIAGQNKKLEYFLKLLDFILIDNVEVELGETIILPSLKYYSGSLKIFNKNTFEARAKLHGDSTWISTHDIVSSGSIFIYSESDLSAQEIDALREKASKVRRFVQFRSIPYVKAKSAVEHPLAFICHDSRDKDTVARRIASYLQRLLCPVWYDEYSLRIGDNLRESIEDGIKKCKKCILIISPNFISNGGWTKKEFDSIFTREILERERLVLPVWIQVNKEQVYEYSPSLLNVKGAIWEEMGEENVCGQLHKALID